MDKNDETNKNSGAEKVEKKDPGIHRLDRGFDEAIKKLHYDALAAACRLMRKDAYIARAELERKDWIGFESMDEIRSYQTDTLFVELFDEYQEDAEQCNEAKRRIRAMETLRDRRIRKGLIDPT